MLELNDRIARARLPHRERREQLMDAAILAISEYGLSNATLGKVAEFAGVAPSMVNFHFDSKQALFEATLRRLVEGLRSAYDAALEASGGSAADRLLALGNACFDPSVASHNKIAVWFAFWGEIPARQAYLKVATPADAGFYDRSDRLMAELAAETGSKVDVKTASMGFGGFIDLCWWYVLLGERTHEDCKELCRTYLANLFPEAYGDRNAGDASGRPQPAPFRRLAAWTYTDPEFAIEERAAIHMPAWHVACHANEIAAPGDYATLNVLGRRAVVVRGQDGDIRAFHNVCRHRGHEVVQGRRGSCGLEMRCPFHGWTYSTTGSLRSTGNAPPSTTETDGPGLLPIDCEVFNGFVFVRFKSQGPSVAERFAPYADVLGRFRVEDMVPDGPFREIRVAANWKAVWDDYLEYDVFASVHPAMKELMVDGFDIGIEDEERLLKISQTMRPHVTGSWSMRAYANLLPNVPHLPSEQRCWSYTYLYPFVAIETYPDMVAFVHATPAGPGHSLLRWQSFALPSDNPAMRATRWLNHRINKRIEAEDIAHVESVQRNLESGDYEPAHSSDRDANLMALHDWVRADMPNARL